MVGSVDRLTAHSRRPPAQPDRAAGPSALDDLAALGDLELARLDERVGGRPDERHEGAEAGVAGQGPRGLGRADGGAGPALGQQVEDGPLGVRAIAHGQGLPALPTWMAVWDHVEGMLAYLLRRLALGVGVLVATAVVAYGGIRALRPDTVLDGRGLVAGTWHDVERVFLHLDFGDPAVREELLRGLPTDVTLVFGGFLLGTLAGLWLGSWSAARRGTLPAQALMALSALALCAPVYVVCFGLLLLFDPAFGVVPLGWLFPLDASQIEVTGPASFLKANLVPAIVVAAPLAAACLRLTLAVSSEARDEDYIRTAVAKGLHPQRGVARHIRPAARVAVGSYAGAAIPLFVTNLVLVEYVFAVPGFFKQTRSALDQASGAASAVDFAALQALALWGAVFIVVIGLLADLALVALDPRIRTRGRVG